MRSQRFLPDLIASVERCTNNNPPLTADFVLAVDTVLPVFDSLGHVLGFAKSEMLIKNEAIKRIAPQFPTLKDIVEADKQAKTVTKKNSGARNLHRLRTVVLFIAQLLQNLISDPNQTLSAATNQAYNVTLGPYHSTIVRGAVHAGLLMLPSRAEFLAGLGEANASSGDVSAYCAAAARLCDMIDSYYDEPMPASTAWF